MSENDPHQFDRLPAEESERTVAGRPTRTAVLEWFEERFAIDPAVFADHTFWERGAGQIWAFHGDLATPVEIEGLGMKALRARQEHWKPTLEAVQRFGHHAERNVVDLTDEQARRFVAGEDQDLDWDGDWGYLVVRHDLAGGPAVVGVGLYVYGELRSQVPKGRRRDI